VATALSLHALDGTVNELLVDDTGHFAPPDSSPVTGEIDTAGWFALPGLADCHAHLNANHVGTRAADRDELLATVARNAYAQLEGGVFLVLDKGTHDEATLSIVDAPPTARPDLQMAGQVLTSAGGYYSGLAREVDETDLAEAVRRITRGRADWVKLIGDWPRKGQGALTNFSEAAMATAVRVAHEGGCRVAIHACAPTTSSMAVAAGVDSIEHGLFLTADDLTALGARGGAWVPTVDAMEAIRDMLGAESSGGRLFADGLRNVRTLLAGARPAGVAVLAGTDLHLGHGEVAKEAHKLAEYGLSADEVVDVLTSAAYRYVGRDPSFTAGHPADVVFIAGDPRDDLSRLEHPVLVLRHGRVIKDARPRR